MGQILPTVVFCQTVLLSPSRLSPACDQKADEFFLAILHQVILNLVIITTQLCIIAIDLFPSDYRLTDSRSDARAKSNISSLLPGFSGSILSAKLKKLAGSSCFHKKEGYGDFKK